MIAIVRIKGTPFDPVCLYELRINKEVICTFEHAYSKGRSECIKQAWAASEKAEWMDAVKVLGGMKINDNN